MHVPTHKKHEYWNHFIEAHYVLGQSSGGGITGPRLAKIKNRILADDSFWQDVVIRHDGLDRTPNELYLYARANYDHCLANFWGAVNRILVIHGLVKNP